ncbi:MAG: hypothetical protein COA93_12075 [Alphaproteobacteria bacterium]|nr:MAG: hypothetical protein COA93_12075 [Alphaproteobacteria bacterium]
MSLFFCEYKQNYDTKNYVYFSIYWPPMLFREALWMKKYSKTNNEILTGQKNDPKIEIFMP